MNIDVSQIEDPEFATKLWTLGMAVRRKAAKKNWQPPPQPTRSFRDHCLENGRPDQAQESARLARERQGERED